MTKEELEKQKWDAIFLEDCAVYDKKIAEEYTILQEQIDKLKKENAELEKAYNETEELLDKQIEATYKVVEENKELEAQIEKMKCCEICVKSKDWKNRSLCVECEKSKSHINFELRPAIKSQQIIFENL